MSRKMKRRIQITMRILCGLSFLWLLGIAGNSDLGISTLWETIVQSLIAVTVFGITAYLGGLMR